MRAKTLVIGLAIVVLGIALLIATLWSGLTFHEYTYTLKENQPTTKALAVGDRVLLNCNSGYSCNGRIESLNDNFTIKVVGGHSLMVPETGNYSLTCLSGVCVFHIESATLLTLALRYAVSGLGILALIFAVMLFKASIYSRPGRNFILVGKHIECRAKSLRKHVCVIKPVKGIESLFNIVLDYFVKELNLKIINRKENVAILKGQLGEFWKGSASITAYQLRDGSVESEFTFSGITAEGALDLEKLAKKMVDLDKKLSRLER